MKSRQDINRDIISRLAAINELYPDQRFGQLLINCDVTIDGNVISFNEESISILQRVKVAIERIFNVTSKEK